MDPDMKENGLKIVYTVMEYIISSMIKYILEIG